MTAEDIRYIINSFKDLNILVVGDLMIDAYLMGDVNRISPEAPVPVISVSRRDYRLGGAANVALNLKALDVNIALSGVIGNDENARLFYNLMNNYGIDAKAVVKDPDRPTTVKTRIISGYQQMMRVDEELTHFIGENIKNDLVSGVKQKIDQGLDVLILEDYNKGVLSRDAIGEILEYAHSKNVITCVDPKKDNFFEYKNVTLFKPNLKELKMGLKIDLNPVNLENLDKASDQLKDELKHQVTLITLSEHGIYVNKGSASEIIPAHIRDIADVSGAGDTVISVAACCLARGLSPSITATIANLSGGLVCEHAGVVPVNKDQLIKETIKYLGE